MSSGWGASRFIAISSLAIRVHTTYKDAIQDNGYISDDVAALRVLIDKAAQYFKTTSMNSDGRSYAQKVLIRCQSVLEDLVSFARKCRSLPPTTQQQVIRGKEDLREILISNTILLNGFVRSCEYRETQAHLAFILGLHHIPLGSRIPIPSIASLVINTDTDVAYKQFCGDLYQIGVTEDIVQLKKDEILDALRAQRIIASGGIGGSDIADQDQLLEMAYKEYCEDLYRMGFTDNMILQQQDEILGILRSRGMATSSTNVMPSFRLTSQVKWFESSSEAGTAPMDILASHYIGTVELLFGKGHKDNTSLLHVAAKGSQTGLAELLLGSTLLKGHTGLAEPLHNTVRGGSHSARVELQQQLPPTNQHQKPEARDCQSLGSTPSKGRTFNKSTPINTMINDENPPLHLAAEKGHIGTVDLLLSKGASIDATDRVNRTPLHRAARRGHVGIVDLLLSKGASIEAKGPGGETPLQVAATWGHTRVVELLLKKGASVDAQSMTIGTSLQIAAGMGAGYTDIVKLLLEEGASIYTVGPWNNTPLHDAASWGYIEIVELLLKKGASVGRVDSYNRTPLDCAASGGYSGMVELLLNKGASVNNAFHSAVSHNRTGVAKLLLENGASINATNDHNDTPLHIAALNGYTRTVKLLLEKGASFEAKNLNGETPLDRAKKKERTEVIRLLENKAASIRHRA